MVPRMQTRLTILERTLIANKYAYPTMRVCSGHTLMVIAVLPRESCLVHQRESMDSKRKHLVAGF